MKRTISALVAATLGAALLPATLAAAQSGTGTITGTVTADDGGATLAGVCVDALPLDGADTVDAVTAGDGTYELEVPEGTYLIVFNACDDPRDGYVATIRGFDDSDGDEEWFVEVEAGTTTSGVDAGLATAGTISGRVTEDGSGTALADVCVHAQGETALLPATATTASDGTYGITTAAPGDHLVVFVDCEAPRFHTPEFHDDIPLWPLTEEGGEGDLVPVTAGDTTDGVDAGLALGGTIEGTITLAHTGEPPFFATLGAWASDDRDDLPTAFAFAGLDGLGLGSGLDAPTPTPGAFDLPGLPPGEYTLELAPTALGFGDEDAWRQRWYAGPDEGAATRDDAQVIDLAADERVAGLELELVPSPSIAPVCQGHGSGYSDVPSSNVHAVAIGCMRDANIVRGGDDGRYRPAAPVRRDQMASFIARLLRHQDPTLLPSDPPDAFSDDDGNVHELSINMLAAVGIVEGDGSGRYRPGAVVARGQMSAFLARAYELGSDATLRTPATSFGDVEGTSHATSIRKVAVAAIAAGTSTTTYEPNEIVRRDQMGTFLARLHSRLILDTGFFFGSTATWAGDDEGSVEQMRRPSALGWPAG